MHSTSRASATFKSYGTTSSAVPYCLASLAGVLLIGAIHLPRPIFDDQAMYITAAKCLQQGGVLYRDFLDVKEPAIFVFYLLAGKLFGFNEVGIHAFELLYWLAFSIAAMVALRPFYERPWGAALGVLLAFGFYYGATGITHQTQIEGLVGAPIFVTIWLAYKALHATRHPSWLWFASGIAGAMVFLFKFIFLLILLGAWVGAAWAASRRSQKPWIISLLRCALPTLAGFLLALAPVCIYFLHEGLLPVVWDNFFVYPRKAFAILPHSSFTRLLRSLRWFFDSFAPLLALCVMGLWTAVRRKVDVWAILLAIWIIGALTVILLQKSSWWEYHFMLLVIPVGLLAARGVEGLWSFLKERLDHQQRTVAAGVAVLSLVLACSGVVGSLLTRLFMLRQYDFALKSQQRLDYQGHDSPFRKSSYPAVEAEVGFLRGAGALPGRIWVCDDPLYYFLSGRMPAVEMNLQPDYLLPEQWAELRQELGVSKAPYIFIKVPFDKVMHARSPETESFIAEHYDLLKTSGNGAWYVLRKTDKGREPSAGDFSINNRTNT